jgi:DNA-binding response OmpR family regulator
MRARVLVVEDEPNVRLGIREALEGEGYEVFEHSSGDRVPQAVERATPDVILLDIMLPQRDGFEVCRDLRAAGVRTPILMLTAKSQEVDKVVGLKVGADDYLTKPFGLAELLARVHALLRRSRGEPPSGARPLPESIEFGSVRIRPAALRGTRDGQPFELSDREMRVLALLADRPGDVVDRETLLREVWGVSHHGTTRTLDQVILKLRKKVESDPARPRHILTVHGVGYRLQDA